ncbi:MAG: hypothetical protein ABJN62_09695 [Halioglobus sp.]
MSEVNLSGIKGAPKKVLTSTVVKYIDWYTAAKGRKPESVHLNAAQWDKLEAELKKKKRELKGCTYNGVLLLRAGS